MDRADRAAPDSGQAPAGPGSRQRLAEDVYQAWTGDDLKRVIGRWERDFARTHGRAWRRCACTRCGVLAERAAAAVIDDVGTAVALTHWRCPRCLRWDRLVTPARRLEWVGADDQSWRVGLCGDMLLVNNRCVPLPASPTWILGPAMDYGDVDEFIERLARQRVRPAGDLMVVPANAEVGVNADRILAERGFRVQRGERLPTWSPLPLADSSAAPPALQVSSCLGTPANAARSLRKPRAVAVDGHGQLWTGARTPTAGWQVPGGRLTGITDLPDAGALAIAARGNLIFVASRRGRAIWRLERGGPALRVAGTGESVSARILLLVLAVLVSLVVLTRAWGLAGGAIAALNAGLVTAAGLARHLREDYPATSARFVRPSGLACGRDGSLYISDVGARRVRRVLPGGRIVTIAGPDIRRVLAAVGHADRPVTERQAGQGPFTRARMTGRPPVAEQAAGEFTADGVMPSTADEAGHGRRPPRIRLRAPRGLAVAENGSVYVADSAARRVVRIQPDGTIEAVAGGGRGGDRGDGQAASSAPLAGPWGVALGPDASVYIADRRNNCVRRIRSDGTIMTTAGSGSTGWRRDADWARSAAIKGPTGVAVAADGTVYVAEQRASRVRAVAFGHRTAGEA